RDDVIIAAFEIAGDGHSEARRYRGGGMTGAEGVVFALKALGETGEPAARAQRAYAVAATGQNLVWIGLMSNVPDNSVARRVEHIMQCNRELDHPESGPQMSTCHRNGFDGFPPQFISQPM